MGRDVIPNRQATEALERSVALDASYAPAWEQLALRYYYEATYGNGDPAGFQKSQAALSRALALDPNNLRAAQGLVVAHTESGELDQAYDEAKAWVERRPDSAYPHFAMSYVLRYAGVWEEAARECDRAMALDSHNLDWRSCGTTFAVLGNYSRAEDFLRLDAGSEFSRDREADSALRQGDVRKAAELVPNSSKAKRGALAAFAAGRKQEASAIARETLPAMLAKRDPEQKWGAAGWRAYVGEREAALQLLSKAVEQNYCGALDAEKDPLYANLRSSPEFAQVMNRARQCREKFLVHRRAVEK
jgi:hypothetical protein